MTYVTDTHPLVWCLGQIPRKVALITRDAEITASGLVGAAW